MQSPTADRSADPSGPWWEIAILLTGGPQTRQQVEDALHAWGPRLTIFVPAGDRRRRRDQVEQARRHRRSPAWLSTSVADWLGSMSAAGWVTADGDRFVLTPLGHSQAQLALETAHDVVARRQALLTAEGAAHVTLVVQFLLAALKLPAALLSGSVAQLNDAADTLLDLFSSLIVYVGLRLDRERGASVVLVALMLATGAFTLFEAVGRLLRPESPALALFPIVVAIGSIAVYGILWVLQRLVGLRAGSLALITQSVDSRNHIIVALGVTAGLLTAPLQLSLVDALVGLGVAVIIARAGVELALELMRTREGGEADLSPYGFVIGDWFAKHQRRAFRDWLLYVVAHDGVSSERELIERGRIALARQDNQLLHELGPVRVLEDAVIEDSLEELRHRGWIVGTDAIEATSSGRHHIRRWLSVPSAT